jgi:hypothetical protein
MLVSSCASMGVPVPARPNAPGPYAAPPSPRARFGQGAFTVMVNALHTHLTGHAPQRMLTFGKPNPVVYRYVNPHVSKQQQAVAEAKPTSAAGRPSLPV